MTQQLASDHHASAIGTAPVDAEVVIVGGGQAGIATAAMLLRRGVRPIVLERDRVGSKWRTRYDRLHLHTHRHLSALPGLRMSRSHPKWVPRDAFADYIERYAAHHGVDVRTGVTAQRIERDPGGGWRVLTDGADYRAPSVVMATGFNHAARMPSWADRGAFDGDLLHATEYRNPQPFVGRDVLVVGAGNTGSEIAQDLAEHGARRVRIAIRTPPHVVPRSIGPIPMTGITILTWRLPPKLVDPGTSLLSRLWFGDLTKYGMPRPHDGVFERHRRNRDYVPILDVGFVKQLKAGRIEVVRGVERLEGRDVHLADGTTIQPEVVIVATGYERGLQPLIGHLVELGPDGGLRLPKPGAEVPGAPGLYAIAYSNDVNGTVWQTGWEARKIARAIAKRRARVAG